MIKTEFDLPRVGDFGIKHGGGAAMWLVRLGTFSRYGHAAEVVRVSHDLYLANLPSVQIVEATPKGVITRFVHPTEFRWSTGGMLDGVLTDEIRNDLAERALRQLGKGYDWPSIAGFVVRFFGAKFGYSPDHPDDKLFCSELVVWNRLESGIVMFPGRAPGDVSPGELADFCPPEVAL